MNIQIWSDIACPFCYIGKHYLQQAVEEFDGKAGVETVYRSFELNPNAPKQTDENMYQLLAQKYGMSIEEAKASSQRIADQGKLIGLDFHFDTLQSVNTLDAHRLIHLAGKSNLAAEMKERLFKAFFTDSMNIADPLVLTELAQEVGLDVTSVQNMLESDQYLNEVRADELGAKQLQINSVPFFIFDHKYAVSGAQPVEVFKQILEKVQQESAPNIGNDDQSDGGPSCSGDICSI